MPTVQMPDGQLVEMPDSPTPQQLAELQLISPPERTGTQESLRRLGILGRGAATGLAALPLAAGDFSHGVTNLTLNALGKQPLTTPPPSQAAQTLMTAAGLPTAQEPLEHAAEIGAGMFAGGPGVAPLTKAAEALMMARPGAAVANAAASAKTNVIKELHDAGIVLPPSLMGGGPIMTTLEKFGGPKRINDAAKAANEEQMSGVLAPRGVGMPPKSPITADTLKAQADDLIQQGYEPLRQIQKVTVGKSYRDDLAKIGNELGGSNSFPQASRDAVGEEIAKYAYKDGRPIQSYTGADALQEIKILRKAAKQDFMPGGDALLGETRRRIATALEDNIERSIGKTNPDVVSKFREARTALAKNFALERMLVDADTGIVSAPRAYNVGRNTPLTDELSTIAKAGSPMFSRATGMSTGAPAPVTMADIGTTAAGGLGHMLFGGPAGAALAALPAARAAARVGVLSKPMQDAMMRKLLNGASIFGSPASRIAVGAPIPLFSQGEQ